MFIENTINRQNGPSSSDIFRRSGKDFSAGFALSELVVASAIVVIIVVAIGMVIVDGQRGWINTYNRAYADVVANGYAARAKFDSMIRKASVEDFSLGGNGKWIEVYYYANSESTAVDRYARFYCANGNLNIQYGRLESITPKMVSTAAKSKIEYVQLEPTTIQKVSSVQTICRDVSDCIFKQIGNSVQMILTLNDGTQTNTIVSSAVMHN